MNAPAARLRRPRPKGRRNRGKGRAFLAVRSRARPTGCARFCPGRQSRLVAKSRNRRRVGSCRPGSSYRKQAGRRASRRQVPSGAPVRCVHDSVARLGLPGRSCRPSALDAVVNGGPAPLAAGPSPVSPRDPQGNARRRSRLWPDRLKLVHEGFRRQLDSTSRGYRWIGPEIFIANSRP